MNAFTPIAEPVCTTVQRISLWKTARSAAPDAPDSLLCIIVRTLMNPRASTDTLLVLADALTDAADLESHAGSHVVASQLRRLAGIPRELAPLHPKGVPACL